MALMDVKRDRLFLQNKILSSKRSLFNQRHILQRLLLTIDKFPNEPNRRKIAIGVGIQPAGRNWTVAVDAFKRF
jgi:hypothetical protein